MTYEGLRLKIGKCRRKSMALYRRRQLKGLDFTIIANNCWGGMIYESYGLPKESPTVGLFFMAEDYIRFLSHLREYLSAPLVFIEPSASRWKKEVESDARFGTYPVGVLEIWDLNGKPERVEIFFLHYHSEEEAREKWERRVKRVRWNHLLVKFNDQNGCEKTHIEAFEQLPFAYKVCFTVGEYPHCPSAVTIKAPKSHTFIRASYEPFGNNRHFNVTQAINQVYRETK